MPERTNLIEMVLRQYHPRRQFLVDTGIAKCQTAAGYLKGPVKIGILKAMKSSRKALY